MWIQQPPTTCRRTLTEAWMAKPLKQAYASHAFELIGCPAPLNPQQGRFSLRRNHSSLVRNQTSVVW
jgi:hypothetical protein